MRAKRQLSIGNIYHVVTRGGNRQLIFEDAHDRSFFLRLLKKYFVETNCEILAWCLMDNHVHLLLRAPLEAISAGMHDVLGGYARYFNKKYDRVGALFESRFKSEAIETDSHLFAAIRYIHQNPVKAGLSLSCDWQWSSYSEYCGTHNRGPLCKTDFFLELFGSVNEFIRFHSVFDQKIHFLDGDNASSGEAATRVSDAAALKLATKILGAGGVEHLKEQNTTRRNEAIAALHREGLSVRQIERLTGIGRGSIHRAISKEKA